MLLSGLTWEGVLSSWVLGTLTYSAFGAGAYAIVCAYFIVGSLVRAGCGPCGMTRCMAGPGLRAAARATLLHGCRRLAAHTPP